MKKTTLILLLSLCSQALLAQSIYNDQVPTLKEVWTRVADATPKLRSVEAAELSPDGSLAVSGSKFGYKVMLWRVSDGALLWERAHESEVECVVFSPDGERIATGGEDYFVRVWDTKTGEQLAAWEHDSGLDGITWSHNGAVLATGSEKGEAFLWDGKDYHLIGKVPCGSTINSLEFTSDDSKLLVGGNIQYPHNTTGETVYDGFASRIDVATKSVDLEYKGATASVKSIRLDAKEKWLVTGGFDSTARVYDYATGKLIKTIRHELKVEAVAFTPDCNFLLVGGHDLFISIYNMRTFEKVMELPSPRTEYIDISDDGRLLLTAHEDSGLISLFLFVSNTQQQGNYHKLADEQLNNRDLSE